MVQAAARHSGVGGPGSRVSRGNEVHRPRRQRDDGLRLPRRRDRHDVHPCPLGGVLAPGAVGRRARRVERSGARRGRRGFDPARNGPALLPEVRVVGPRRLLERGAPRSRRPRRRRRRRRRRVPDERQGPPRIRSRVSRSPGAARRPPSLWTDEASDLHQHRAQRRRSVRLGAAPRQLAGQRAARVHHLRDEGHEGCRIAHQVQRAPGERSPDPVHRSERRRKVGSGPPEAPRACQGLEPRPRLRRAPHDSAPAVAEHERAGARRAGPGPARRSRAIDRHKRPRARARRRRSPSHGRGARRVRAPLDDRRAPEDRRAAGRDADDDSLGPRLHSHARSTDDRPAAWADLGRKSARSGTAWYGTREALVDDPGRP